MPRPQKTDKKKICAIEYFRFFTLNQPHPRSTFVHLRASLNRRRRAAVKVRLIHSEHFFLSPKARKKPRPQKNRQEKNMCNRIFSFFTLNQPHPRSTFVHLRASLNRRRRAAVKVRLIHSEHFFLSPKARKKPRPQKNRQEKNMCNRIFSFFALNQPYLCTPSGKP